MKYIHTEGIRSILRSRFARGVFPLVAALLAFALAAPEARADAVPAPDQPVLIDTSSSAGSVVTSSVSAVAYPASKAFDDAWSTISADRWLAYINPNKHDYTGDATGETPAYVVYRFNAATKVNMLRIRIPGDSDYAPTDRAPKAWTFRGSNDGETWTTLDTRSGVTWASGTTVKTFSFENGTKYAYYKFECTEIGGTNDYLQIYELQFLYDAGIVLTDLTTSSSGGVSDSSATLDGYPGANAFDGLRSASGHRWLANVGADMYVTYRFNEPTAVNLLGVFNAGAGAWSYDTRAPKDWTFQASNDGTTWTTLDTQTGETGWGEGEVRYYSFKNNARYTYYKYSCTANNGQSDYLQLWELEFYFLNQDGPALGNVSLARTGALAYSLSATEDANAADLSYILSDGETVSTNGWQSVAEGNSATWTISGLSADTTWQATILATNASDTAEKIAGTLYTGELSLGATTNANEYGLVAGGVTVSRANADPFPLTVNYTISGSAGSQGVTWAAPEPVVIPANATSTVLPVVPIVDATVTEDVTITVTLATGNYEMPAVTSATLTLVNLVAPSGYNVWIAPTNGLASVASNWSAGHAPTAQENVLFNGDFSQMDCEWDSAASATVASWTQTNGYTGTVTVDTVFPEKGSFTCLTVSGDMNISSGSITHKEHTSTYKADQYRLRIDVGGDLTVASGAKITARAKGSYGPRTTGESAYGGSYNGNASWGSLTEPYGVGSSANGNATIIAFAGGAIWLEVAGATKLDGSINANGIAAKPSYDTLGGSGGAVYLKTGTLSGAGSVSANCEQTGISSNDRSGAGGRVSILLTSGELDSFPNENLTALSAYPSYANVGSAGTVLVRSPLKPNGILFLRDRSDRYSVNKWGGIYSYRPKPDQLTRIPLGQTWVLDEIVFGPYAILQVPTGTTLDLRGGLASVSSTATALDETGLIVDGGTLLLPSAETHTISGKWIFEPKDFALEGNLVVTNGAGVGTLLLYSDTSNNVRTCSLAVSGNMHVASGAYLRAVRGGYIATGAATVGGGSISCHGGQCGKSISNVAYDSFFHPRHPGTFGADNGRVNVGGGAIRLSVGGTLTLDGVASATPIPKDARSGAPGSIDITAARLEGAGSIDANGNSRNYSDDDSGNSSGGGRIAVRLTGAGETFSDAWLTKINAKGYYTSKFAADRSSSAGSIYLQTADQAEGAGTIVIRNTGNTANNVAFTAIPSVKGGGEDDDFRKASLKTEAAARVKLFDDLRMAKLEMEADTVLDLNGKTLAVRSAMLGNEKLAPGTYAADNAAVAGFVVDSATGGALVVTGGGFQLIVR